MTLLAYILLGLAVTGVMFDAWTTHRLIHRPGFREVGIPWRWVPVGLVVLACGWRRGSWCSRAGCGRSRTG
jgi:hypothetical protein